MLRAAIGEAWSVECDSLRYVPKGAGSYHWLAERDGHATHFVTVDDLDTKPWIGRERDATFAGLCVAYGTAWALHQEEGIAAVVAPIRCVDGSVAARVDDRYSVAVFPFVDGTAGTWGDPLTHGHRTLLLRELAGLHRAVKARLSGIGRRPHVLPERDALHSALAALDSPWTGGAFSEPARRALADNVWRVRALLEHLDALAAQLDGSSADPVVTHGEPHPGNRINQAGALRIIDWDTVALAEPERDLWMLDDGTPGALAAYTKATGTAIDQAAIAFYRLAWTLSDIASYADLFRGEHPGTRWAEEKLRGFVGLLEGAPSAPYSH
jgi:spectinomycin phosphotransferase